jgi:hypothetical protein
MATSETKVTWFYQHRKGVLGPVDSDELRFLAITGKVNSDTLVRAVGATEWIAYSQSPAAMMAPSKESPKQAIDNALHGDLKGGVATRTPPSDLTSRILLPLPRQGVNGEEGGLRIVSAAAILALLILALLLSSFWGSVSSARQFAGYGPSGREGIPSANQELTDGAGDTGQSNTRGESADTTTESLQSENSEKSQTSSLGPTESSEQSVVAEDQPPPSDDAMEGATKTPLAEQDQKDVADPPAKSDSDPDRFVVALAPKQESGPGEKTSKPKATPAALQHSNLSARSGEGREKALDDAGGSMESEKAVAHALEWLRRIQRSDGSWDFEDAGKGAQSGSLSSPLGATAMATLCFLGSGSTTRTGPDKELVKRAFEFMISQEGVEVQGTDSMYVHALVTLCLTELAAMEPDEKIFLKHAVNAVRYIEKAQDPRGGGWRYTPQTPGDTSVTGWDVMALQSGQSAGIKVDKEVVNRAQSFLDSVSDSGGAAYAYTPGSPTTASMTAVGLLCRMYLGWPQDSGPLQQGIHRLSSIGVSRSDMYYNYYATIALHHFGGTEWDHWNAKMRDQLVLTQITKGEAAGSWPVTDPHGRPGGQIYQTCLSVLTLEVYYRYLPLYRQ